ncbi:hypothetical protein VPHK437A_0010 [Vibrio phage K437a]
MDWQKLRKTNLPPRGVKLDILVTRYGKPSRLTNCTYMSSLECFRTEMNLRHIKFNEVTHWMVVEMPGEEVVRPATIEDCVYLIQEAQRFSVFVNDTGVGLLPSKYKQDVSFQLRGVIAHLGKVSTILHEASRPERRFTI